MSTRKHSLRSFRELYGLSPQLAIFRSMRDLWNFDESSRPLLAILCAVARDHVSRATVDLILSTPKNDEVTPGLLGEAAAKKLPNNYQETTLSKIGRNTASSWQQSGHPQCCTQLSILGRSDLLNSSAPVPAQIETT